MIRFIALALLVSTCVADLDDLNGAWAKQANRIHKQMVEYATLVSTTLGTGVGTLKTNITYSHDPNNVLPSEFAGKFTNAAEALFLHWNKEFRIWANSMDKVWTKGSSSTSNLFSTSMSTACPTFRAQQNTEQMPTGYSGGAGFGMGVQVYCDCDIKISMGYGYGTGLSWYSATKGGFGGGGGFQAYTSKNVSCGGGGGGATGEAQCSASSDSSQKYCTGTMGSFISTLKSELSGCTTVGVTGGGGSGGGLAGTSVSGQVGHWGGGMGSAFWSSSMATLQQKCGSSINGGANSAAKWNAVTAAMDGCRTKCNSEPSVDYEACNCPCLRSAFTNNGETWAATMKCYNA